MSAQFKFDTTTMPFAKMPVQTRSMVFSQKPKLKLSTYLEDAEQPMFKRLRKTSLELKADAYNSLKIVHFALLDTEDTISSGKKLSPPSTHTTAQNSGEKSGIRISQDFVDQYPCEEAVQEFYDSGSESEDDELSESHTLSDSESELSDLPQEQDIQKMKYVQEYLNSFLSESYTSEEETSSIDESMGVMEYRVTTMARAINPIKYAESRLPEGDAYSTALNMVHLPTEVASINELGEVIDSLDNLPVLERQESGATRGTKFINGSGASLQKIDFQDLELENDGLKIEPRTRKTSCSY